MEGSASSSLIDLLNQMIYLLGYLFIAVATTPIAYDTGRDNEKLSGLSDLTLIIGSFIVSLLWPYILTVRILKKILF